MHKQNAILNGEWGAHVRPDVKRRTHRKRRRAGRAECRREREAL